MTASHPLALPAVLLSFSYFKELSTVLALDINHLPIVLLAQST